jgi:hypothetical protein
MNLKMKEAIKNTIRERQFLALTAFKNVLPEIEGDYTFYFPTGNEENSNIVLIQNVSKEFIHVFQELIEAKIISFSECSVFEVMHDSGEVYDLPIVKRNKIHYKTPHWLPLMIKKGERFKN